MAFYNNVGGVRSGMVSARTVTMKTSNRNSWGPMSLSSSFHRLDPDEEFAEEYTERMMGAQMRQLDPLKEDLADWLNKTLGIDYITRENFLSELDNGVVLCHLAQTVVQRAKNAIASGLIKATPPTVRGKCFEKAMRRSFFSRDNMENFIKFCRSLGVHENLLFESDDLVMHNQPRNVVLCLLEVARLVTKFGIEPPGLVQLEKEIAEEEKLNLSGDSGLSSMLSWQFQAVNIQTKAKTNHSKMKQSLSAGAISSYTRMGKWETGPHVLLIPHNDVNKERERGGGGGEGEREKGGSDGIPSDNNTEEDDEWSRGSGEDPDLEEEEEEGIIGPSGDHRQRSLTNPSPTPLPLPLQRLTELDKKVQAATRLMQKNCSCSNENGGKCSKLQVRKVGEGKYNIAGRNVFVRLLKGRHMMVRVGGGWDTLDHFLLRHDPCQEACKETKQQLQRQEKVIKRAERRKVQRSKSAPKRIENSARKYTYYKSFNKLVRPGETAL